MYVTWCVCGCEEVFVCVHKSTGFSGGRPARLLLTTLSILVLPRSWIHTNTHTHTHDCTWVVVPIVEDCAVDTYWHNAFKCVDPNPNLTANLNLGMRSELKPGLKPQRTTQNVLTVIYQTKPCPKTCVYRYEGCIRELVSIWNVMKRPVLGLQLVY